MYTFFLILGTNYNILFYLNKKHGLHAKLERVREIVFRDKNRNIFTNFEFDFASYNFLS